MKRMVFAAATLFASLVLASGTALADGYTNTFNVSNATDFMNALSDINDDIGANDTYLITLTDSFAYSGESFKHGAVTIEGNGNTISGVSSFQLTANSGAVVNLNNVTIQGVTIGDTEGIFHVLSGTTLNLNNGTTLTGHKSSNYLGGGVTVQGGTLNMNDGSTISECGIEGGSVCYGGGVAVFAGGIFTMNGGTIKDCYAESDYIDDYDPNRCFTAIGGGVFVSGGSTFTMNGGNITNNRATNFGGGVALDISYGELQDKGMGSPQSAVTINNGMISGNKAGNGAGVYASGYFYSYANALATLTPGTGTTNNPGLDIKGGEISDNTADASGGGIYIAMLRPSTKANIHNVTINNNKAAYGAGVDVFGYWMKADIDTCTITNNKSDSNGAGIRITQNSSGGETTLKNSIITGNTITDTNNNIQNRGAGVYYDGKSKLNISGANTIQNNTYNSKANNLNILDATHPVYVNGSLTGSQIGLSDPTLWGDNLTDEDSAAVSADYLTSGYAENNTGVDPSVYFTSDHSTWHADFSDVNVNEVRLFRATEPLVMVLPYASGENMPHAYSDAGYYGAEEGDLDSAKGVIRFSTYVECVSGIVIDHIGTTVSANGNSNTIDYAIPSATDVSFTFSVDVTDIPKAAWGTGITATSYAKSGSDTFNSMNSQTLSVGNSPKWLGKDGYSGEVYTDTDPDSAAVAEIKGGN